MTGSLLRPSPEAVPVADALASIASGGEELGVLTGRPLLAVRLDGAAADEVAALARQVAVGLPCVVVGLASQPAALASPPAGLDVLLADAGEGGEAPGPPWRHCPEGVAAALAAVAEGVGRSPQAATVLVQVLRLGRGRSLDDALALESLAYATLQSGREHRRWLATRQATRRQRRPASAGAVGPPAADREREPVLVAREGGTLAVTLARPEVRNAVDVATRDGLVAAFDLAARDPTVERVELRGEGPDFCSGGDLDEFGTTPDPAVAHLVRSTRSPARALARCAGRTTTRVQGACIGAGLELAALTRRVVAEPGASFRLPEVAMGLIPGAGGTATIPRRIGPELTAWMALTGQPVDAPTALAWGLVDEIAHA